MQHVNPPQPTFMSGQAIADYAEKVAAHHEVLGAGPTDLDRLLLRLGGHTSQRPSRESMTIHGVGNFTIFLPAHTSRTRDRFTIAHELGHYFLHYRLAATRGQQVFTRSGRNQLETEANVFASALLMPATEFESAWHRLRGNAWDIAVHFDVSPAAVNVRASVLGLT